MGGVSRLLLLSCFLVILLQIGGMLWPSHYDWGVHFLAFYDPTLGVVLLIFSLSLFLEPVRRILLQIADSVVLGFSRLPLWTALLAACAIMVVLALVFPSRGTLLGDSRLILKTLPGISSDIDLSTHYHNQPFFFLAIQYAKNIPGTNPQTALTQAYEVIDLVALVVFIGVVFAFVYNLDTSPAVKLFSGVVLIGSAGSQLFFGYIENYAPSYAVTAAYVVSGWLALKDKVHLAVPMVCFLLMIGLHIGALIFVPTIVLLLWHGWKKNRYFVIVTSLVIGAALIGVAALSRNNLPDFFNRMSAIASDDVLPAFRPGPGMPFAMFSLAHVIDWTDLQMLVAPFGLLIPLAFLISSPGSLEFRTPAILFLLSTSVCGLLFTFIMNSAIGLFRDWDLMASFCLPLSFFGIYLLSQLSPRAWARRISVVIAVLVLIHTATWIGVNADNARHLQRAEVMTNTKFLGRYAQLLYYDQLANAFWDKGDYARTKNWLERYLTLDSTNPRFLGNLADVYLRLGENNNYYQMLQKLARNRTPDAMVYSNLGVEYSHRGDTAASIAMYTRALELDSNLGVVHANLAITYLGLKRYDLAFRHCSSALALGMAEPEVYKCAGIALYYLGEYKNAMTYLDSYLTSHPEDEKARALRDRIKGLRTQS